MGFTIKTVDGAKQRLKEINDTIQSLKGKRDLLLKNLTETQKKKKKAIKDEKNGRKAMAIIRKVGKETQQEIEYYLSEIPSLALSAVFDDPYSLDVEFVERNDRNEADITFLRGDNKITPLEFSGVGAVDVASFGLRPTIMNLQNPPVRRILILDEAFKHLKGKKENIRVIQMLKEMSEELGIQIIMVHDERVPMEEIEKGADRIFKVSMKNRISKVETL